MSADLITSLKKTLLRYHPLSDEEVALIADSGEVHDYDKNEIIITAGRYNAYEYFQLSGISHRYNQDEEQKKVTTGIYCEQEVITPHFARTRNNQSIFSLQAITPCQYVQVAIGSFDNLRLSNPNIRDFGQRVVEKEFRSNLQFEVLFRSSGAKERLEYFRQNYAMLENVIPHGIIASFLGITPVSFSRLRNGLLRR